MAIDLFENQQPESGGVDLFEAAGAPKPKKQNKGILGDIGTGLKRGVEQMPGMVTGIADIAAAPISAVTGFNRPFSKAADYLGEKTGFQPGKWAEQAAQEYSPEMQQSLKNVERADGFVGTLGAIAENPRSAVNLVAESLPSTLAGGILARGAMGAVVGAEKLAAMKAAGDTVGLMKAGAIAGGIGEGVVTAGQQMSQTDYSVDPLRAAGAATAAGIGTGIIGGISGRVANRIGLADIEGAIASGTLGTGKKAGAGAYAGRIAGGALQEGALEELPQSSQEQVWQNLANGKPWDEGVGKAAAQGLVAGMAMGAGVNALPSSGGKEAAPTIVPPARDSINLITDPAPIQGRIDALLGIGDKPMGDAERAQYTKDLEASFGEVVGYASGENGLEVPVTMEDYLRSTLSAADMTRDKPKAASAVEQSANRLQQLADEETTQQPDIAAPSSGIAAPPVIPIVGPLSAVANMAVQSGAHAATVAQQAAAAQAKAKPAGPLSEVAAQSEQANGIIATQAAAQVATPGDQVAGSDLPGSAGVPLSALTGNQGRAGNGAEVATPGLRPAVSAGGSGTQSATVAALNEPPNAAPDQGFGGDVQLRSAHRAYSDAAANQIAIKKEAPSAATVSKDIAPAGQDSIKNQSGEVTDMVAAPAGSNQSGGAPAKAVTPTGREVDVSYQVRELSSLISSHDDAGAANPNFPAELQPRDRSRAASDNQVREMVSKFNPRFLGKSETTDDGAPIVDDSGVVESGNGRTMTLRRIYREQGDKAQSYRDFLQEQGFDTGAFKEPVLVRVRQTPMTPAERVTFTQDSNKRKQLGMAASEVAEQDAALMTADVLDKYVAGDVVSAANRDFVRAFVGKLSGPELADMLDAAGSLSQTGKRRIEAGLLTAAYGKSDLVQELFESADTDIKAIGDALKAVSGQWAGMRNAAKYGVIDPAMDMTGNLMEAVNLIRRSRSEGSTVHELAGQGDLMSGNYLHELSEAFLRIFYKGINYNRARGGEKVISALHDVVTSAMQTKSDSGLFGDSFKPTTKQVVDSARSKLDASENQPATQSSLFNAAGRPATGVSQEPDGGRPEATGEGRPRPVSDGGRQQAGEEAKPVTARQDKPAAVDAEKAAKPEVAEPSEVETDQARIRQIKNSIAEGELILKSGKAVSGRKMSADELAAVQRSVDSARRKIGDTTDGVRYNIADDNEIFYSQLQRAIESAPDKVFAGAGQFKLWLNGNAPKLSIKKDEIQWSGINEYLDAMGKGKVSKADVLAYLENGGVKVEETMLGDGMSEGYLDILLADNTSFTESEINQLGYDEKAEIAKNEGLLEENEKPTKYSQYTLPGGKNYRELLLTLPEKTPVGNTTGWRVEVISDNEDSGTRNVNVRDPSGHVVATTYGTDETDAEIIEHRSRVSAIGKAAKNTYRSSHFDQKNILAHVRFDERNDADGNKVLFIHEVQSDWGQEGKKKGFDNDARMYALLKQRDALPEGKDRDAIQSEINRLGAGDKGVPAAPFVTDTKDWVALAIKRMMRYAADNGFDKIAFVNGQQSADRYDLSKQVSRVEYKPESKELTAFGTNGSSVLDERVEPENIEDYIGKEAAKRLLESEPMTTGAGKKKHSIAGDDLKVGGEGMKTFYDQIVPQVASDLLKKMGGKLDTVPVKAPYKNAGDRNYMVNTFREKMYAKYGNGIMLKMTPDELAELGALENGGVLLKQTGFTLPPAAKSAMPLFAKNTAAKLTTADKAIYGMAAEGKSAAEILKFIAATSRNPFYRQVAKLLLKTGINPSITVGDGKGWKMNAGEGHKYAAAYNPDTDTVALFRPASSERNMLHELVHAATIKALAKGGMASAQMKFLFAHVQRNGKAIGLHYDANTKKGVYGMANIDEFIAEAFSNPKFQALLKQVSAPTTNGKLSSAWNWFVRIVRGILGVPQGQENALSQALEIGVAVMRENMKAATPNTQTVYAGARGSGMQERTVRAVNPGSSEPAQLNSGAGGKSDAIAISDSVQVSAIKAAQKIQDESNAFDLEQEIKSVSENGEADISSIGDDPRYWDAENEEFTEAGFREVDRLNEEKARDNLRLLTITELSDLDGAYHHAQYKAMLEILNGMGIEYKDTSSNSSKYLEVGRMKIRFANHANTTRGVMSREYAGDGVETLFNVAPGEHKFSEALDAVMREDMALLKAGSEAEGIRYAEGQKQTDTDAFRKWFGKSAVVDANGEPMVVYHGTASDIAEFDGRSRYEGGIYFTPNARLANGRARIAERMGYGEAQNLLPVYLVIKNPAPATYSVEQAKAEGYDGLVRGDGSTKEYVVFDPTQIKSSIGNNGDFSPTNPDIRYNVADDDGWQVAEPSKMDDVIYAMQDKHIDTKRVMQAIMKTGKKIRDSLNPYLQEELFHGRSTKGVKDFLDLELRPLLKEMQAGGVDMGDFEEYLWNRHAPERNAQIAKINPDMPDGGSGIKTADAKAYLSGLSAEQKAKYAALAKRIDGINKASQQVLVASGLEKQETIDAWNGAYQNYVPLQREDVDTGHVGTGKGFSVRGSSTKRAMGSGRAVVDIIGNLTMQRERNIVRAEKNRVSNAWMGLAIDNPNADFWTVDKAPKERVVENKAIYTVTDDAGTKTEFTRMGDAEKFARSIKSKDIEQTWGDRVTERVVPGFSTKDHVLLTRINGEDHYIIFNERDERAMRMVGAMKNLDMDSLGRVLSTVGKATRYLAAINTQYNPVFGVINLIRDAQGALINLSSTPLAGEQKRVFGYTKDALIGIYADIRAHRAGKVPSSKWAALFEEFQKEGGQTGYRDQYANAESRAEAVRDELAQFKEGKAKQFTRGVFGWLSDYNETMENAVRLAAYKAAKEKGMSNQQAASLAKNITVNFNRKGQVATQVGALYAFFNASVQGSARMAETLFEMKDGNIKTARLSKTGKKIMMGGIMLGSMQALLLAAAGFDDDEPPEFIRERNLILPIGDGKYLTLAMPLGFHVIPGIGRIATEFVLSGGKDPLKRIAGMASMFAESFNPIGSAGFSLQTITPSVVDPFAALAENRDFTGKEIYRENRNAMSPTPGHERAKDVATIWSRYISEAINFMTGGTEFKPGMFSPSPDSIDYLIGQLTGGVGREVNKVVQTGGATVTGEDLPLYKIPLVGRFIGDTEGQSGQSAKFYDAIKQINMHEAEMKGLREQKRFDEAKEYAAENPGVRLIIAGNYAERTVQKLRSTKRDLIEKDADKEQIRAIDERITTVMRSFNERAGAAI